MPSLRSLTNPRLAAGASRVGSALPIHDLAKDAEERGLLENLFRYLDLPGTAVRSLLTGEGGTALRSLGAFALPGLVDQPEERPDFGFLGNLATDPLLFLTGGGAGAKAAIQGAGKGLLRRGAVTKATARVLGREATKSGRKYLRGLGEGLVGKSASRSRQAGLLRLARKATANPKLVDRLTQQGLLRKGGLRLGLPFTEGKTIAAAGKSVNLAMASPYYWAARSVAKPLKNTKLGQGVVKAFDGYLKKLYPGFGMTETGKHLVAGRNATTRRMTGEAAQEVVATFKTFDKAALEDFHRVLTQDMTPEAFKAAHAGIDFETTLARYKAFMDKIKEDLVERGIWEPRAPQIGPTKALSSTQTYVPRQLSDEAVEAIERLNFENFLANTEDVFQLNKGTARGLTGNVFQKARKYSTNEEFEEAFRAMVPDVDAVRNLNVAELAMRRAQAHARTVANFDMLKRAKKVSLRDRAFGEWARAGAGRLSKRGAVGELVDFVNRKAFKPMVTVGVGPIVNPAFNIRNMVSGIWQAAAHPGIGAASGLRHTAQIIRDGIASAVEKVPGIGKLPRSQMTNILRASKEGPEAIARLADRVVKGTQHTEREIAGLLREHGVVRHSFVSAERIADELEPIRMMTAKLGRRVWERVAGTRFPGQVAEAIEDRMRSQGFVHALRKGLDPEDAAQATREAFIDYEMVSDLHRNIRDYIPFAQFTIGQTPRTVKTALTRPRVLSPLTAVYSRDDDDTVLPPWVREQPNLPLGQDREGNTAMLAGLGTPFEDINKFGSLERGLLGSLSPMVKIPLEQATGRDPYFQRPIYGYRRRTPASGPLADLMGQTRDRVDKQTGEVVREVNPKLNYWLGRLPWSRQISMANQLWDTRRAPIHKMISLLTGAKVVSVDQDKEIRKLVLSYLKKQADDGNVVEFRRFFADQTINPELSAMIKAWYAASRKAGK